MRPRMAHFLKRMHAVKMYTTATKLNKKILSHEREAILFPRFSTFSTFCHSKEKIELKCQFFFELSLSFILSLSHYMSFKHNCSRNWHSFDSFLPNVFRDFSYLTDVRKNIFILDMEIDISLAFYFLLSLLFFSPLI